MDSHQEHLVRGFNWLGGATILSKVIDFSTILVVLLFLTKDQVGLASLVVSFGMVIEAVNGFGTNEALVQASTVSRHQLDTLFWFIVGAALLVAGLTLLAAPWIAMLYGSSAMTLYFVAIAIKQPVVGAAVIPLAMLNRNLQYERIAIINVCSTLAAALTRLSLAIGGAGAWALVLGYAASGLYTLIGATIANPFRPSLRFQLSSIVPLVHYGLRAATSNVFEQLFKNVDYLLVGWFYGAAPLAVYRVAFDIAMEPAMAVGTLVNRTALPVFAKLSSVKQQLALSLTWALGRLSSLVFPLMAGLMLVATPLSALLHDKQGHSYAAAALPLKLLAAAALLRVTTQLLYPLLMGSGRPGVAARLSATTLLLLTTGILITGLSFPATTGIVVVAGVWLAIYPLLLLWGGRYLWRHWDIRVTELVRPLIAPSIAIAILVASVNMAGLLGIGADPRIQIGLVVTATALTYCGLFLFGHHRRAPVA
jgi:O-antigen/teichoic acid export membrane protein